MMFSDGLKHSFISILIVVNGSVVVNYQEIKTVYQHLYQLYYLDFIFLNDFVYSIWLKKLYALFCTFKKD